MPLLELARIGGAADPHACAAVARALIDRLPADPYDAAVRIKRLLAARGFRDDGAVFALPEMLERRAGNCLGLTLLVGALLLERGHAIAFEVRLDPLDDVHDAGAEYFARLCGPATGVDGDSRLPDARDRRSRFRFAPVEHASIVLVGDQPFEATNLVDLEPPPGWAPAAETVRRLAFEQLAAAVWCERAKLSARAGDWPNVLAFALRALRGDPDNREAWAEVWQAARMLERPRLAAHAVDRHAAAAADDSLFWFTRFRLTGDAACLDRALARLPAYAEAYLAKHVLHAALDDDHELRRRLAIAAWLYANSEVLELEQLYRSHGELVARAFSPAELATLLATF